MARRTSWITKLLVKALTLKPPIDWPMMWEIANDTWKFLGKNAGPVWTAYEKVEADDVHAPRMLGRS